jgi:heat shock protein HslJ
MGLRVLAAACGTLAVAACASAPAGTHEAPKAGLAGAAWRLQQFQSSYRAGSFVPSDPSRYELTFLADGRLAMRLDCNRGTGSWTVSQVSGLHGQLSVGPAAMTRMACPPGSMDSRVAADMSRVRSYVIEGDQLHLNLKADGGVYTWLRIEQ